MTLPKPYPLSWPDDWRRTPVHRREKALYRVNFSEARNGVVKDLRIMTGTGSRDVPKFAVTTNVPLRLDGLPLANMREPEDPGVAVWWIQKDTMRVMACDSWGTVRENLRAVGVTLDALRAIERSKAGEILDRAMQSFGAKLLPASTDGMWWRAELGLEKWPPTRADVEAAFKERAKAVHPDRTGSSDKFLVLQRAKGEALAWIG